MSTCNHCGAVITADIPSGYLVTCKGCSSKFEEGLAQLKADLQQQEEEYLTFPELGEGPGWFSGMMIVISFILGCLFALFFT